MKILRGILFSAHCVCLTRRSRNAKELAKLMKPPGHNAAAANDDEDDDDEDDDDDDDADRVDFRRPLRRSSVRSPRHMRY